jgi:putative ABC transport system permease protein
MRNDFFKLAARQIWKNQLFSFVNFTGLALGLAFFFLTIIWYRFEHSYDGHYPLAERLYRLDFEVDFTGSSFTLTRTPAPFAPLCPIISPKSKKWRVCSIAASA